MALLKPDTATAAETATAGLSVIGAANPFAPGKATREETKGVKQDMYGFCSIEDFPAGISDLGATHEDALGFHDYVKQFNTPNFWYKDGNVQAWIYGETYDNWQDDYGFDAARVVYHSGHGDMDGNGVFWIPMGATWGGTAWASSNDMRLGNEMARYVFFSTCLSLRVHAGHSPIRTWYNSNLGLRMLFGFETISIDSPNYGKFFFQEWNKGADHSFSDAWLDASWRIYTKQAPSAVGFGATQAEAQDRCFNERAFFDGRPSKAWWWWRWYDAAKQISAPLETLPDAVTSVRFLAPDLSTDRLSQLAQQFGVSSEERAEMPAGSQGIVLRSGGDGPTLSVTADGTREIRFARPDGGGRDAPDAEEAVRLAQQAVESFGLAENVDLIADKVRHAYNAGASREETVDPRRQETTVVLTQVIDGVPVVTPGVGEVRVSVDGTGTVTRIVDASRRVEDVLDRSASVPPDPSGSASSARSSASSVDEVLDQQQQRLLRRLSASGRVPTNVTVVPETTEVGYSLQNGDGTLVARRTVEVDCGEGLRKQYVLEQPL
ncbi:hypothetical protein EV193_102663 [Herbihabitans rhizosphaerae]|uniref:Uncharacterized protein n=1 Tax=Herbihabitans rhizosphaerae TaxID=1872711 RepID=A0A4Q7L5Y1_9PSEU|nr:DUF6345 domain-containing protein [Herbihabitans rhizosphaerae]RZS43682.1 hypothetical protein EV193_102663 [Herbihabitans rhizosphaerae]